jgi:hypothetical protein
MAVNYDHQAEQGVSDARDERARGCALEPVEAHRRALRAYLRSDWACRIYWLAYAEEVESWD